MEGERKEERKKEATTTLNKDILPTCWISKLQVGAVAVRERK